MGGLRLSPRGYRRITFGALVLLAFIIVSGAAVRLTGSGLGCSDWPNCEPGRLVAPRGFHPWVEFGNRLVTGAVSITVIVAVLGAFFREPFRRDLAWLAAGLVAGVVGQIVLGGLTVLFELRPPFVIAHFLLSTLILWDVLVLHHRAGTRDGPGVRVGTRTTRRLARAVFALTWWVVLTGTVVTAAGPHGGDERAQRLSWPMPDAARLHGSSVTALVGLVVLLLVLLSRSGAPAGPWRAAWWLVAALVGQAAVGYTQYFTELPPLLVGMHVAGAVLVFSAATHLLLSFVERAPAEAPTVTGPVVPADALGPAAAL